MLTTNVLRLNSPSPSSGLLFARRMRQQQEGSHQMQFLKPGPPAYEAIRFCSLQISVALCIWSRTNKQKVQELALSSQAGRCCPGIYKAHLWGSCLLLAVILTWLGCVIWWNDRMVLWCSNLTPGTTWKYLGFEDGHCALPGADNCLSYQVC